ncbi:MAG: polysaccharide deacetylase family protein [Bacteroidales bacterium]|nr:polysaccharide deacetylase family protein [Bacteroidales bacterium]
MKKMSRTLLIISAFVLLFVQASSGQQTLAEKLGYTADASLLIVHADDIGLAQSVNEATAKAFASGGITSGSIMVPCPWFNDFAEYYKSHPDLDVGIHITLTSEWDHYKFGGILPATEIPSLLDENGYFYPTTEELGMHADPAEAEKEIRAQIERAISYGIRPTHLDTHMGSVLVKPELLSVYMKLGKEYGIPVFAPRMMLFAMPQELRDMVREEYILADNMFMLNVDGPEASCDEEYEKMIEKVVPGLNVMIVHLAFDNAEMQAVTVNYPAFGATWREKDLNYVQSQAFRDLLKRHEIHLVSWKEIGALK